MGYQTKLEDGRWHYYGTRGSAGDRLRAHAIRDTLREAKAAVESMLDDKAAGQPRRGHRGETFAALVADYRDLHLAELSPTTQSRYESILRAHLEPVFGKRVAAEIDPTDVLRYKAARRKGGFAPLTVEHHLSCLRGVLSFGVRTHRLEWNVADAVKGKKPRPQTPRRSLTTEEAARLLTAALEAREFCRVNKDGSERRNSRRDDLYGPILLALDTGLRRGEVLGLRWVDIELEASALYARWELVQAKGRGVVLKPTKAEDEEVRPILLSPIVLDELRALHRRQSERRLREPGWNGADVVFCTQRGNWPCPDTLTHHVSRLLADCEIPNADFHTLRHTHATWLRDDGIDPETIRERQGHADMKTTAGYMHAKLDVQAKAAASLQKRLAGA